MKFLNIKVFNGIVIGLFAFFILSTCAFAINIEYKNSLSKVELCKVSNDTYTINLYTAKQFLDPVQVVKKNDLNYYILLPETQSSSPEISAKNPEIRYVTATLYPYAGQDVNNGYTKITIATSKPINFDVNIKNSTQESVLQSTLPPVPLSQLSQTDKIQKKNLQNPRHADIKAAAAAKIKTDENETPLKTVSIPKTSAEQKAETKKERPIELVLNKAILNNDEYIEQVTIGQTMSSVNTDITAIKDTKDVIQDEAVEGENLKDNSMPQVEQNNLNKSSVTEFIYNIIHKSNVNVDGIIFMLVFGFIVFCMTLFILTRKPKQDIKIKSRINLANKNSSNAFVKENNAKYFDFGNKEQTLLTNTFGTNIKKNYQLTDYEPEFKESKGAEVYSVAKSKTKNPDSEYEIIQKILKEDDNMGITDSEYNTMEYINNEEKQEKKQQETAITSPIAKDNIIMETEPQVLSKVEIAPEKGFMCVSYNNNISLIGYIYDDVFALYNFKRTNLEAYEIKYRFSDKDAYGENYIVKVNNTKVVINVGKNSMQLQVVM